MGKLGKYLRHKTHNTPATENRRKQILDNNMALQQEQNTPKVRHTSEPEHNSNPHNAECKDAWQRSQLCQKNAHA